MDWTPEEGCTMDQPKYDYKKQYEFSSPKNSQNDKYVD